jgi:glucuronate isomerase
MTFEVAFRDYNRYSRKSNRLHYYEQISIQSGMKSFITSDFLLETDTAGQLYHDYAATLPIVDYHCHLSPSDIANDRQFKNLTEIWLDGDHYKWRAMRTLGIDEKFITGDADPSLKFKKWAETVPYTMRNPLYHWTHMELQNYFGVDQLLDAGNADEIYQHCSDLLGKPDYRTRSLLKKMNVETLCTTDDPSDTLEYHKQYSSDSNWSEMKVLPAFRPDKVYTFQDPDAYISYIKRLGKASGTRIHSLESLLDALGNRVEFFHSMGCRLADHGLENMPMVSCSLDELNSAYQQILDGDDPGLKVKQALTYFILLNLGRMYHSHNWVQQYHLGALRNTNSRMLQKLGPDSGFDSIGDFPQSRSLAHFLDELDSTDQLARTIIYNLNPRDNEVMATLIGNYNDGSVRGKIQFGSAWWFLDQKEGIEKHLNTLSNMSLLSCFIGMLTDSRSFLSYPRHEYFRRILCNLIGKDVERGELPADIPWLGGLITGICYNNAKEYFNF